MTRLDMLTFLQKVQRRLPAPLAESPALSRWKDEVHATHWIGTRRKTVLEAAFRACRSDGDLYEFAASFCPAHQIRHEILGFLELARSIRPLTVLEIGTAEGSANFLLGAALPEVTLKIGADLFVRNTRLLRAFCRPTCQQVFVNGSSYDPQTVARIRALLGTRRLDLLFIDGDHRYEGAKADWLSYAPLVRPGGLIAFHDIVPDHKTDHDAQRAFARSPDQAATAG